MNDAERAAACTHRHIEIDGSCSDCGTSTRERAAARAATCRHDDVVHGQCMGCGRPRRDQAATPRDLAAEARLKADDMRVNLRFDIARLLTELADKLTSIRTLASQWAAQVPVDDADVQQIEDGCALLLLIDGRTLPEEPR